MEVNTIISRLKSGNIELIFSALEDLKEADEIGDEIIFNVVTVLKDLMLNSEDIIRIRVYEAMMYLKNIKGIK